MDDFEKLLKASMRREDPPAGFEQRVMAATRRRPIWRPLLALAAMLALMAGAGWEYEQSRRERAQGEAAAAKLELALQVTGEKLHKIQQKMDSMSEGF
jgi:ferric-dicitrate binding protein FerR (iron transport regulator)